jgi:uncharacterized protein YeaO (DUF488 family)
LSEHETLTVEQLEVALNYAKKFDKNNVPEIKKRIENLQHKEVAKNIPKKETRSCNECTRKTIAETTDYFGKVVKVFRCPIIPTDITIAETPVVKKIIKDFTGREFYIYTDPITKCERFILPKGEGVIRVECYVAVLKQYREDYPDAHFEIVTRQMFGDEGDSVLSPSWDLLKKSKAENWPFEKYTQSFLTEMRNSTTGSQARLAILKKQKDLGKTIFLVCVEKDPQECHRSILKKILDGEITL